ncbi:MAG: hypothetical protein Q8P56_03180 [Candidatus Uhrbacteria bacterium]|nr:hypothetical protein [Candidatus Uhrbacteria bacterium]
MSNQATLDNRSRNTQTITVPKKEYDNLRAIASRFEMMRNFFELDFFAPPPTRDSAVITRELQKTGKYNKAFLKSIERGLEDSSYFCKSRPGKI